MIGVIGPEDLVRKILKNSSSFFPYAPSPLIYRDFGEVPEIVRSSQDIARGLFFSGPIPYLIAASEVDRRCPWVYLPYGSTGLLVATLNASLAMGQNRGFRFSVDTVEENETRDVLRETNLKIDAIYTLPYTNPTDPFEDFFLFHTDLYRRGMTDFAMTCVESVKKALVKVGIPTFTVAPALPTIRRTIQLLNLEIEKASKDSMKAVVGIIAPRFEETGPAGFERKFLSVHQALLTYSAKHNLLAVPRDYRSFRVVLNLGQLGTQTHNFTHNELYHAVFSSTGICIDVGYGAASNITIAEEYAEKALEITWSSGGTCYLVDGEKATPIGKDAGTPLMLSGEHRSISIGGAGMTVSSLTRYLHAATLLEDAFSSAEFARHINITKKAARKILSLLLELQVIEICGKRHISPRGRPETLYRLVSNFAQKQQEIISRERG